MAFGITSYINGVDVITQAKPLSSIYAVRLYNLGAGTVVFTLPDGVGDISYSGSLERGSLDREFAVTASNGNGYVSDITISGNTVTMKVASANGGYSKELFYTFYRRRS